MFPQTHTHTDTHTQRIFIMHWYSCTLNRLECAFNNEYKEKKNKITVVCVCVFVRKRNEYNKMRQKTNILLIFFYFVSSMIIIQNGIYIASCNQNSNFFNFINEDNGKVFFFLLFLCIFMCICRINIETTTTRRDACCACIYFMYIAPY